MGDTGCTRSCVSEAFLRKNVKLYKRFFRPMTSSARSIDGSKVVTVGTINLSFRLGKTYRRMNCRVVRNLIHDLVLGWDFFEQYDAQLYAKDGYLMCQGERINLLPQMSRLGGARYAMMEEFVIPPASKAQFQAALLVDSSELDKATNLVCMEPADLDEVDIRTARCISKVEDGKVLVEAINPFGHSVKIPEGTILGFAEFITEQELDQISEYAGMDVKYDSAYESMEDSDVGSSSDAEGMDDCEAASEAESEATFAGSEANSGTEAGDTDAESERPSQTNPERDKKPESKVDEWKIDYSKMTPQAKQQEDAFRHLFEVKHAKVMAKHERDYGRTTLTQHHARLIDKTPIASPPYRVAPDMQKIIDKQVNEMLADGLLSHSTSAYSAPILLVPKKQPGQHCG